MDSYRFSLFFNFPRVKTKDRTKALALLRTAGDVGMLTGSMSAGLLADYFGQSNVVLFNGTGLVALSLYIAARFARLRRVINTKPNESLS